MRIYTQNETESSAVFSRMSEQSDVGSLVGEILRDVRRDRRRDMRI